MWYGWIKPYRLKHDALRVAQESFITVPLSNSFISLPTETGWLSVPVSNQWYSLAISNNTAILPVQNGMVSLPMTNGILNLSATNIYMTLTYTTVSMDPLYFYINYVNLPLISTIMALLGFYITYAAYRAFKIKSLDGIVMMSVAVIVMIGYDPVGNLLTMWLRNTHFSLLQLPVVAQFLKETMNGSVFRSLNIGIYIATIAISWRIWIGLESQLTEAE